MYLESEDDLKEVLGLRWKLDEDRSVIATTIRRRLAKDHLYLHGPGKLGIYYEARTRQAATGRRDWWIRQFPPGRLLLERRGDLDGCLVFRVDGQEEIPGVFLRSQNVGYARVEASSGSRNDAEAMG